MFNATFNNISVISWTSVLLVEETRVPRENHWSVASHWQTLSHNVVPTLSWVGFKLKTLEVVCTDFVGFTTTYAKFFAPLLYKLLLHLSIYFQYNFIFNKHPYSDEEILTVTFNNLTINYNWNVLLRPLIWNLTIPREDDNKGRYHSFLKIKFQAAKINMSVHTIEQNPCILNTKYVVNRSIRVM